MKELSVHVPSVMMFLWILFAQVEYLAYTSMRYMGETVDLVKAGARPKDCLSEGR